MRRVFWVALGATAGILVVRRVTAAADSLTPAGLAGAVSSLGDGLRVFGAEVRAGMAERELELRDALGFDEGSGQGSGQREVDPEQAAQLTLHPTSQRRAPADGLG